MRNAQLENGILVGVHNKRGVTSRGMLDGGTLERNIAKKYREWADATKIEWPKTSSLLKEIARSFENTARFQDEQAERTDWEY
jgi:predicted transglutaminase-like protease